MMPQWNEKYCQQDMASTSDEMHKAPIIRNAAHGTECFLPGKTTKIKQLKTYGTAYIEILSSRLQNLKIFLHRTTGIDHIALMHARTGDALQSVTTLYARFLF